jgi:DNA-directed RNA polymerase specialized sigma24 family protein
MCLAEIAESLEIPLGTVKSRLHYATATLRAAIEADARTPSAALLEERLA